MKCRHCKTQLTETILDLGTAPPSNAYITQDGLNSVEPYYPLRILVCTNCWLVQTEDFADAETLFSHDYAYFSGFSSTWHKHVEEYVKNIIKRFSLDSKSKFVEIASNDGTLLEYVRDHDIPCLGIEPTASTAKAARGKGLRIVETFFGASTAKHLSVNGDSADAIAANNVLAHVPDINDFVDGCRTLLKPKGLVTFEFPHILNLVKKNQFDTIYHEHFSYLSLIAVSNICQTNGLHVFDVEKITTHGGSLRVYAQRKDTLHHRESVRVQDLIQYEKDCGLQCLAGYSHLQGKSESIKDDFVDFLIKSKKQGKTVCGYGAAAKGNTLLNFAGIRQDLLQCVADKNPSKQGKFLPGSRIPICDEAELLNRSPNVIVILPWNLRNEVIEQLSHLRDNGCEFVTVIPELKVFSLSTEAQVA